jgi:hypothetical protein
MMVKVRDAAVQSQEFLSAFPSSESLLTSLHQRPLGIPTGFLVTQCVSQQGIEWAAPLAERLVADLNTALVEQFLNILVTERKAVVQPDGGLNDSYW